MGKLEAVQTTTAATIEEALEKTNFGKFNYFIIIISGLIINNVVLESVGISFVLPVLECDLQLSNQQQGLIGAISFIGIICSSHLWGFLADTTGRKRIMQPGLLVTFMITVISSFSTNFWMLLVMRFLNGVMLSSGSATVFAYLGEFHCSKYRNRAILSAAFISAFFSIFFPMFAWVFINQRWSLAVPFLNIVYKPWRVYMIACGFPGFVCGLFMFRLPESPKYLLSVGRNEEALAVIKDVFNRNRKGVSKSVESIIGITTLLPDQETPTERPYITSSSNKKNVVQAVLISMWHQTAPLFQRTHLRKTLLASFIQFIIFFTAHGVYMWFPYILNRAMQYTLRFPDTNCLMCDMLDQTQSANFSISAFESDAVVCVETLEISTYQHTIVLELIYVALLLIVSYAIGKFGRIPILFTILLVCGGCGILSLVIKIPLVAIYLFVVLLCCGLATLVVNVIVVDIYPTNLRAMAVCISLMAGRIGSVTGSNVLGALIATNCSAALYSSAGSLLVAGGLSLLFPRNKTPKTDVQQRI